MTQASTVTGSARIAEENRKSIARRNLRTGLLFTAPALIVLAVFVFYPAIETFIVSLTNNRINRAGKFIGFENYIRPCTGTVPSGACGLFALGGSVLGVFLEVAGDLLFGFVKQALDVVIRAG